MSARPPASQKTALTIAEVCHETSLCRASISKEIAAGRLEAVRYGRRVIVLRKDLEAFLERLKKAA